MSRPTAALLICLAGLSSTACGQRELEQAREQAATAITEADAVKARLGEARDEFETTLGDLRKELSEAQLKADLARTHADESAAHAETEAAARSEADARVAELEARAGGKSEDKRAKKIEGLEAHNAEMVEWIEEVLLPCAEKADPKLAELRQVTDQMAKAVERIRGLAFKRPFMRRLITRDTMAKWMRRDLPRDFPPEELRATSKVFGEFGIVRRGTDLTEAFVGLLEGAAMAFYKPQTNTFYLIDGNNGDGAKPIVFHELIHALEDQYYDIDTLYRDHMDDDDALAAVRAVVEGSADLFQSRYHAEDPAAVAAMMKSLMAPEMMQKQMKMLQQVPSFLVAMWGTFPYKNGSTFLRAVGATTPELIEKLHRDPPVSSEQILHPEKFPLEGPRDYPQDVATPDVARILGDDWEEVKQAKLGELMTGLVLVNLKFPGNPMAQTMNMTVIDMANPLDSKVGFKSPVEEAVHGWDGDRYVAFGQKDTDEVCVVWTSVWDSTKDASEFASTYAQLLGPHVQGGGAAAGLRFVEKNGQVSGVALDGSRVVVVLGAPPQVVDALFAAGAAVTITPDPRDPNDL